MENKVNIHDEKFENYLINALKSHGYLFPTTDDQMFCCEKNLENHTLPEEFESPDFVFAQKGKRKFLNKNIFTTNSKAERNWSLAARDGKDIPEEILLKMKKDKEAAKKIQNGDK